MSRILFIGNSFTSRNDLPHLVARLAAAAEHPRHVEVEAIVAGGASLKRHWNGGRAQEALRTKPWDFVVLQEQSTLPFKNRGRYHDNLRLFAGVLAELGVQAVLYLTWSRRSAPETQAALSRAVYDIAEETGALVVPVGVAWHDARRQVPGLELYEKDGSHPGREGSYLAACMFLVALFDTPVRGDAVADALKLDHAVARKLEAVAWACRRFVRERPAADEVSAKGAAQP